MVFEAISCGVQVVLLVLWAAAEVAVKDATAIARNEYKVPPVRGVPEETLLGLRNA